MLAHNAQTNTKEGHSGMHYDARVQQVASSKLDHRTMVAGIILY